MANDNGDTNTTRREFLASAISLMVASGCATHLPVSPVTQPGKVWLNMGQAELDAAYTQSNWAPNRAEVMARYKSSAEAFRSNAPPPLHINYGSGPPEGMEVWKAPNPNGKVLIFIHGGAWAGGTAVEYSFVAERWIRSGVHVVIPDFSTAEEAGGSLTVLAEQIIRVVEFTYKNATTFGGNPDSLYIAGHSSGAHLAAVALTTDWPSRKLPKKLLRGGILVSGMYDLKPVRLSSRSRYIKFTDEMENALSPQRQLKYLNAPLVVAVGANESPEFKRQYTEFVGTTSPKRVKGVSEILNHFEMLEALCVPSTALYSAARTLVGVQ